MRHLTFSAAPAALVLLLAACVPPPTQAPVPVPTPAPAPAPAPAPSPTPTPVASAPSVAQPVSDDWVHAPLTPGDWTWRREGSDSIADFRSPQGQVVAQVACTAAPRQVFISAYGWNAGPLTIRTETTERQVTANLSGMAARMLFQPGDSLLDAIAFSRGRFAIEDGRQALYLPSYPEITRVIEDCR